MKSIFTKITKFTNHGQMITPNTNDHPPDKL